MFRIAPEALIEIGKIAEYLTAQSPSAADGFERRLEALFTTIESSPHMGRATNRRHIRLMNSNPYPYLIFYTVRGDEISVLRVVHGARNRVRCRRGRADFDHPPGTPHIPVRWARGA